MKSSFWYEPNTAVVISIAVLIVVGLIRSQNGGYLFDPDKAMRDGIAGVVVYTFGILWYAVVFDISILNVWSQQPLGKLTISMAMIGMMMSRLNTLWKSCRNR